MYEKEKAILSFLGVIVSLVLLAAIIIFGTDFTGLKLKYMGRTMMQQMQEKNYGEVYTRFIDSYNITLNRFTEEQNHINTVLGSITKYKFQNIIKDKDKGRVSLIYNASFTNYPAQEVSCSWNLVNTEKGWKLTGLKLDTGNPEIQKKLCEQNTDTSGSAEVSLIDTEKAKELALQVIEEYNKESYRKIYTRFDNANQNIDDGEQFVRYMETAYKLYGPIDKIGITDTVISKDKQEIQFQFTGVGSKVNGKINLLIWVRMEKDLCLSGIKINQNTW